MKRIIPFLTPLLSIAGYFLLNKKIKDVKEIEPFQNKLIELLKNMDEEEYEKIKELFPTKEKQMPE